EELHQRHPHPPPLRFKGQPHPNTDDPIVVILRPPADATPIIELERIDGFGNRRALETKVVRDGRKAAGRWFWTAGLAKGTQTLEVDGLGHLIEIENPETSTYRNNGLRRAE